MRLNDIAMVAADTSRSRAYLQSLVENDLLPNFVLVLDEVSDKILPGQLENSQSAFAGKHNPEIEECWSEISLDLTKPIRALLDESGIPYDISVSGNINDASVVVALSRRKESVFIYSGFGGQLLRKDILNTGKLFLHVHGGYLPEFKGSTANYYSLIIEGTLGASAFFLNENIDSGPILLRRKFRPPMDLQNIDHIYDSAARAKVLVESLKNYLKCGGWEVETTDNSGGETYYIIHPVLKHIAILGKTS